jgi:DNA-binding transcriptional LysR family regulator
MSLDRLAAMETFVTVVDTGSFSAAARRLNVGQPAVSKSVAQLEDRLGVRLLLRSTRGLAPTEAGQSFYERAKRSIEEADEADLAARGAGSSLTGRLRVCAPVTFGRLHIMPHLPIFLAEHPDLAIDVIMDDRVIDLVEEGIDVAIRTGTLADSALTARKIGQCRRLAMGTPAYFAKHSEPVTPSDLMRLQAVVYSQPGNDIVWTFQKGTSEVSVTMQGRVRASAAEGVREAVLAGMGITVASEWMFLPELKSGVVKAVLKDWQLPPLDLSAVFPTGRLASAKARAFVFFVESCLGKQLPSAGNIETAPLVAAS